VAHALPVPRKRRTREHVIADLSVYYLERFILEAGHTAERQSSDYGYDMSISTFDELGFAEAGHVDFQLKASDTLDRDRTNAYFVFRMRLEDYNLWIHEPLPVFLILYNAIEKRAYWLDIQDYFFVDPKRCPKKGAQSVTVFVPVIKEVDSGFIAYVRQSIGDRIPRPTGVTIHE
jgi:Domain of unknown function (DUF4365)